MRRFAEGINREERKERKGLKNVFLRVLSELSGSKTFWINQEIIYDF